MKLTKENAGRFLAMVRNSKFALETEKGMRIELKIVSRVDGFRRLYLGDEQTYLGKLDSANNVICMAGAAKHFGLKLFQNAVSAAKENRLNNLHHCGTCAICGKALKDPASLAEGVGRDCLARVSGD